MRCPFFETSKRYGCPEITRCFCDGDDTRYGNLSPKLIWGRTKTIGRGGDCCDFMLKIQNIKLNKPNDCKEKSVCF